jgi:hypothetical protein
MPIILGSEFLNYYKEVLLKNNFYNLCFESISSELIRKNYEQYYYVSFQKPFNIASLKNIIENFIEKPCEDS